eukprot:11190709-Lingulodinium_polyedra.AAC.1
MRRAPDGVLYVTARDVDDLFRPNGYIARQIFLPPEGPMAAGEPVPVIVTRGSPCQDVAVAIDQGLDGRTGP